MVDYDKICTIVFLLFVPILFVTLIFWCSFAENIEIWQGIVALIGTIISGILFSICYTIGNFIV